MAQLAILASSPREEAAVRSQRHGVCGARRTGDNTVAPAGFGRKQAGLRRLHASATAPATCLVYAEKQTCLCCGLPQLHVFLEPLKAACQCAMHVQHAWGS